MAPPAPAAAAHRGHVYLRATPAAAVAAAVAVVVVALLLPRQVAGERHVTAAPGHVCMVRVDGSIACVGNTTTISQLSPPAGVAFHAVTVGDDFLCGLAVNGSLLCWGALPGGTAQLPPSTFFIDAHAGPRHVCALTPNGTVLCYGDASSSRGAINVPPGVAFQGVTSGANYTCGVARNHSVVCWGDDTNPVVANASVWRAITDAEHVAAGADHACYVRVTGSVACWGSNARGAAAPPPALAATGSVWWLAAGGGMTCAMTGPSVPSPVTCWGAVNGTIAAAGYEVACAGWGCAVAAANTGNTAAGGGGGSGRVVIAAAVGGLPLPQTVSIVGNATVTTLAGKAAAGGVDGVGTAAQFNNPRGVSLDGVGGLYVADFINHMIRRVDITTRTVTTVAGVAGSYGTTVGATPLQSKFNNPCGVEVDAAGNVYVADTANNAIRMLSGVWVAGTGTTGNTNNVVGVNATFNGPRAVRADAAGALLYVGDYGSSRVRTIIATGGSHSVATLPAGLANVNDITLNMAARVMYVAATHAVYTVTYAGTATLLAGQAGANNNGYVDGVGSAAQFYWVAGLALDADAGLLYATESSNHRLRVITIANGNVTTLAGSGNKALTDGIGTAAAFNSPWGIALDAASSTLFVADSGNNAIRRVQLPLSAFTPAILAGAPLPPSPLVPTHQLSAWRALGTAPPGGGALAVLPVLDARNASFSSPVAAANTAGLNPVIGSLLLRNVTLASRDAATPAAAGNTNTTFSTSAQRGLRSLTLTTRAVPAAALALPALTDLALAAPVPSQQQLQLMAGSFDGLATLTCVNCGGVSGLANLSGLLVGDLLTRPPYLPLITALDASVAGITAVYEQDFDNFPALHWLSLAGNNLTYVSDATFSGSKQSLLAAIDQSNTPLTTGAGCPPTTYLRGFNLAFSGASYSACTACPAGDYCGGGPGLPVPCGANTYATGGAAACVPCPAGMYAEGAARQCIGCLAGLAAPACNATASWRSVITLVADGAGSWANTSIYLVPFGLQPGAANVSCGPLSVISTTTVSCALPFLLPSAAIVPVVAAVWVAHAATGGAPHWLGTNVTLIPPPPIALATGGGVGLAPHTAGSGRVVLRLPASRLVAADWDAVGLRPPAQTTIDDVAVWLAGVPCISPVWETPETATTVSCATTATDTANVPAVVQLAGGMFNISGVLPTLLLPSPALGANTELQLLPSTQTSRHIINITLVGVALCTSGGGEPQVAAAAVAGVPCASVACIPGRTDAALCVGWNASDPTAASIQRDRPQVDTSVTVQWVGPATRPVTCDACVVMATRPVLTSITPTSIAAPGIAVVITGSGMMDATATPPAVRIGGEVCTV